MQRRHKIQSNKTTVYFLCFGFSTKGVGLKILGESIGFAELGSASRYKITANLVAS